LSGNWAKIDHSLPLPFMLMLLFQDEDMPAQNIEKTKFIEVNFAVKTTRLL
jgi:hypothetical protein